MIGFKQFLEEEGIMDATIFSKLVSTAAAGATRLQLYCRYDGALHEGFVQDATPDLLGDVKFVRVNYWQHDQDHNTFIPASMSIYIEDLHRFYIAKNHNGHRTLLCRDKVDEDRQIYAKKIIDAPAWAPEHAEAHYTVGDVTFSATDGLGSVPSNANVWYEGFVALMKPSTFLQLALSDDGLQEPTSVELEKLVKEGYAVGIPFLSIMFDPDGNELPRITGHEGRGRMRMLRRVLGDRPVPVHFLLCDGMRSRHLTPEMTDEVKQGVFAERSERIVRKPVEAIWVNGKKV